DIVVILMTGQDSIAQQLIETPIQHRHFNPSVIEIVSFRPVLIDDAVDIAAETVGAQADDIQGGVDEPLYFNPAGSEVGLIRAQDIHIVSAMAGIFAVLVGIGNPDIPPIVAIGAVDAYQSGIGKKPAGGIASDFLVIRDVRVAVV